jgi:two-component system NarL family sensor kinase
MRNDLLPDEFSAYFNLAWLFVLIFFLFGVLVCYLWFAIRRARRRESQSAAFSRLTLEGQEEERRRIARELHDEVLPELKDKPVQDKIRRICANLMPPDFERFSLGDSLAALCAAFSKRSGIECGAVVGEDLDLSFLDAEEQLHLYRMVQEAFTNIEKHAGAQRAALIARNDSRGGRRRVLVCVSDDGKGFSGGGEGGFGIRGMKQRADILGAVLEFKTGEGNGTMVRIEIPCRPWGGGVDV